MAGLTVVIVGGGSAGCVLAARLSEQPAVKVTLIEAGVDVTPESTPADIADLFPRAYANPSYFWPPLRVAATPERSSSGFSQPRILGGGSSVMGMWALRGLPEDYDGWARAGARGWSYDEVLPFFEKIEGSLDDGSEPGKGPVQNRSIQRRDWPGFAGALGAAAERNGMRYLRDPNAEPGQGYFPIPFSTNENGRATTATAYLTSAVRKRPNLRIICGAEVRAVVFSGREAVGVRYRTAGDADDVTLSADQVILSAGAIHSPALLMRSGIGPAEVLKRIGVDVVHHLPAVGSNLQNHVFFNIGAFLRPHARQPLSMRNYAMAGIRTSSNVTGALPSDLFLSFVNRTGPRDSNTRLGLIGGHLYAPMSRGAVTLNRNNETLAPVVDFRMLSDSRDATRILRAGDIVRNLLWDEAVRAAIFEAFILPNDPPIRRLTAPGLMPTALSWLFAAATASGPLVRRAVVGQGLGLGRIIDDSMSVEHYHDMLLRSATVMFHPAGTCAIGSVVDPDTRVHGVESLHVIDASIMPTIPRGNTNMPTIMLAERSVPLLQKLNR